MEKTELMNLEEAIEHCKKTEAKETLEGNLECALEHKQLSEWLSDYKNVRAKSEAYDRLLSGGKKTLKEWANIFGMYFAVSKNGVGYAYKYEPLLACNNFRGQCFSVIYPEFIDYTGDWRDSLTLPDGWEEREGE